MNPGVATSAAPNARVTSVLDRPLHELTEDDIAKITREDCRRFLKHKGMRKPSWNKSQAIQQVIFLKSLLDPPPELPTPPVICNSFSSVKELSPADGEPADSMSADNGAHELSTGPSDSDSLRYADVSDLQVGQMTIFYCGKVNVYDGVPVEKAQVIMQLAASPDQCFQEVPADRNFAPWATNCQFPGSSVKMNVIPAATTVPHLLQSQAYTRMNRKASLQRYLEKRKDRERLKIRSRFRCRSIENQSNNAGCVADLNDRV